MASHADPGTIQVTDATAEVLASTYRLERRAAVAVKGKGEMTTFRLLGRR
jgi:class 3 adenylate cyclase